MDLFSRSRNKVLAPRTASSLRRSILTDPSAVPAYEDACQRLSNSPAELLAALILEGDRTHWRRSTCNSQSLKAHWIDAILRWVGTLAVAYLEEDDGARASADSDLVRHHIRWQSWADALRLMADRVDIFLDQHPAILRTDCEASLKEFWRLVGMTDRHLARITRMEGRMLRRKQTEMTERSITESRSAIGCKQLMPMLTLSLS